MILKPFWQHHYLSILNECLPLFPVVFSLHLCQSRYRSVKCKKFLLTTKDPGLQRPRFSSFQTQVIDQHSALLKSLLMGDLLIL